MVRYLQKRFVPLFSLVELLAGCATAAPGFRPGDMSAADHALVAAAQRADADWHRARYDPAASRTRSVPTRLAEAEPGAASSENPTAHHLAEAERLREHALAHEAAARALRATEEAACVTVPEAATACPLDGAVAGVDAEKGGARLLLAEGTEPEALLGRIRCHLAHARTLGYGGMEGCPLYVEGLRARIAADRRAIELIADEGGDAALVYARARALFTP
jgi:hypothetical protein